MNRTERTLRLLAAAEKAKSGPRRRAYIEPGVKCARPSCKHSSSVHRDTVTGPRSGVCEATGCSCPSFKVPTGSTSKTSGLGGKPLHYMPIAAPDLQQERSAAARMAARRWWDSRRQRATCPHCSRQGCDLELNGQFVHDRCRCLAEDRPVRAAAIGGRGLRTTDIRW